MATRTFGATQNVGRQSMAPGSAPGTGSGNAVKTRQLAHLQAQLGLLSGNLADTENLLRMTGVQAESMRGLGSWHGGLFMAASKVLGEESVKETGR